MVLGEVRKNCCNAEETNCSLESGTGLHASPASLAAQNFNMPALSPTMTEGNIANWKVKEGTIQMVFAYVYNYSLS